MCVAARAQGLPARRAVAPVRHERLVARRVVWGEAVPRRAGMDDSALSPRLGSAPPERAVHEDGRAERLVVEGRLDVYKPRDVRRGQPRLLRQDANQRVLDGQKHAVLVVVPPREANQRRDCPVPEQVSLQTAPHTRRSARSDAAVGMRADASNEVWPRAQATHTRCCTQNSHTHTSAGLAHGAALTPPDTYGGYSAGA